MAAFPKNYLSIQNHIQKIFKLFQDRLNSRCFIVGNGPSVSEVSLSEEDLADAVIFRANWFFLEDTPRFGRSVDGFFWSVDNAGLRAALADIQAKNEYQIKAFFQPFISSDLKDHVRDPFATAVSPNYDHWALIATNSTLARFMMGRPLPTQGMQMLAFAAVLGFKRISLAGIDLYQEAASRYAWKVPDHVKASLQEKDYSGGYEKNHNLDIDLSFLRTIRNQYDFELTGLSSMTIMAPYLDRSEHIFNPPSTTQSPTAKHVYVTLADNRYVLGAMALARSLAKVTDIPLLVLHTAPETPVRLAHIDNILTRRIDRVESPFEATQQRFENTLTKLRIFELFDYDRIVFIDADCIVLQNIDELFDSHELLATPDWGISITKDFNSGLFAFNPTTELQERIFSSLQTTNSSDGGDQGFLNSLFGDEVKRLPPEYNTLKRFPVFYPNLVKIEDIKVLHYVGDKPWDIHQNQVEFSLLEKLWTTFLTKEDWIHVYWMNKNFISKRWHRKGKKREDSYPLIKKYIFILGNKIIPRPLANRIDSLLKKIGFW